MDHEIAAGAGAHNHPFKLHLVLEVQRAFPRLIVVEVADPAAARIRGVGRQRNIQVRIELIRSLNRIHLQNSLLQINSGLQLVKLVHLAGEIELPAPFLRRALLPQSRSVPHARIQKTVRQIVLHAIAVVIGK